MSTDRTPFEAHLADDTLLLLGDVTDEAALRELVDALTAEEAFGEVPGIDSPATLVASWRHLTDCSACTSRQHALMGVVTRSMAGDAVSSNSADSRWSSGATDARIAAALDALSPSVAAVADNLERRDTPVARRSWFALGRGRNGTDGVSVGQGGVGAFAGRRLLILAAVAAVAVGTIVALRPNTSQVGALKVTADTTAPADGFAAERAQSPVKKAAPRNDAAAAEETSAAFDEPVAELAPTDAGATPATTPVLAGAVKEPTPAPAPESGDEATTVTSPPTVDALDEPASAPVEPSVPVETPIVGAAPVPPPAPAPQRPAIPAPAKKAASPANSGAASPATNPAAAASAAARRRSSSRPGTDGQCRRGVGPHAGEFRRHDGPARPFCRTPPRRTNRAGVGLHHRGPLAGGRRNRGGHGGAFSGLVS